MPVAKPPVITQEPLYQMLRMGEIDQFNNAKASSTNIDFSGMDFRSVDLRGLDADGVCFENAYFRGADLRGVDFRLAKLAGASLANANISGTYFPEDISADEIRMSIEFGTRIRRSV